MKTKHDRIQFYANKMVEYYRTPERERKSGRYARLVCYQETLNKRLITNEKVRYHMF